MTAREIAPAEFRALKVASRSLVRELGTLDAAATVCRWGKSALAEACDLSHGERTLPIDVVADLERVCGEPVVTRVLAGLSGHVLLPVRGASGPEASAIAHVLAGAAGLGAKFAAAMDDARVSAAERQGLKDALLALHTACADGLAALAAASEQQGDAG